MSQYDRYFLFDEAVPYKGLMIYPVKIRDYMTFLYLAQCLMLEKNSLRDPAQALRAIQMTYLEYMCSISDDENNFLQLFVGLIALVTGKKDDEDFKIKIFPDKDNKPLFKIGEITYDSNDFDQIRQIIAEQNSLDLPDETIQKDVRDKMEEARRFKERVNGSKMASFEEQIMALALYSGWELEKIYNMTIRKFIMAIGRANHMIMSNIYLTASMSGFVSFKDKSILKGWLTDLEEPDKYADVKMSLESIQDKVSGAEAMKQK